MADAVKDAKLRLDLDTTKAVRGMEEVVRAGEKVERQLEKTEQAAEKSIGAIGSGASAAAKTFERFGETELSKSELRVRRRSEKSWERKHDAATASLEEYRLNRHYAAVRSERQRKESWESMHDDAMKRLDEYRLGSHYKRLRQGRDEESKRKRDAESTARDWNATHDDAMKRLEEYRLGSHYKRLREDRRRREDEAATAARERDQMFRDRMEARRREKDSARLDYQGRMQGVTATANVLGGNPLAVLGAAGASGMAVAAVVTATAHVVREAGRVVDNYRNVDLSKDAADRALTDKLTFGVSRWFREVWHDMSGVTDQMRNLQIGHDTRMMTSGVYARQGEIQRSGTSRSVAARAAANASAWAFAPPMARYDQSTLRGWQLHEEELQMLPARDAVLRAERQRDASMASLAHEQRQFRSLTSIHESASMVRRDARTEADRLRRRGTVEQHHGALLQLREATTYEEQAEQARVSQINRVRDAAVSGLNAEIAARRANIDVMRTQMSIEASRLQRHSADASRIARMNPADRHMGLRSAEMLRDYGWDNVPYEVRDRAAQFAPEYFERMAQEHGESIREFQIGRENGMLGAPGTATMQQMRTGLTNFQDVIRNAETALEARYTDAFARIMEQHTAALMRAFEEQAARARDRLTADRQLSQANQPR